jgi:LCP family protein required for cell wall assembly
VASVSSSVRDDDTAPPRATRRMVWRGLLAGVVICFSTAGAVSASVLLLAADLLPDGPPLNVPVDPSEAGEAQTLMIIGSDRRRGDERPPRSDTIMLVRLDPAREATTITSIPRDLLVDVPGVGERVRINAAYEHGGAAGTLQAVRRLLSTGGRPFEVHHVITVDFAGFRRAIDYVGCVYTDIDRDYFNDRGGPGGYAVIDVDPGYQKLCGADALAYVRYRHGDNDLVRGARQQDFLRQARGQEGIERLISADAGNLRQGARIFNRYFESDRSLRDLGELFRFAKTVMFMADKPVRQIPFRVTQAPGDPNSLVASRAMVARTVAALLDPRSPAPARPQRESRKRSTTDARLESARTEGEDRAILAAPELGFPFYFPTRRTRSAAYEGQTARTYTIKDEDGARHDAYRLVLNHGFGEYYGVQGTTWRDPPILADAHETVVRGGRRLDVYRDGKRTRLVAWHTRRAVYWVSNTLTRSLTTGEMLGIAASLRRLGR